MIIQFHSIFIIFKTHLILIIITTHNGSNINNNRLIQV